MHKCNLRLIFTTQHWLIWQCRDERCLDSHRIAREDWNGLRRGKWVWL